MQSYLHSQSCCKLIEYEVLLTILNETYILLLYKFLTCLGKTDSCYWKLSWSHDWKAYRSRTGAGACTLLLEWETLPEGRNTLRRGSSEMAFQYSCQEGFFLSPTMKVWNAFTFTEDRKDRQALCVFFGDVLTDCWWLFPMLQVTRVIPVIDLIVRFSGFFWTLHLF